MKHEILHIATKKIDALEGVQCKVLKIKNPVKAKGVDAAISVRHSQGMDKYLAVIRREIIPSQVPKIIEQAKQLGAFILLADYITPSAKELLRGQKIPYADTAGNIFLISSGMYIYIQTNRSNRQKLQSNTRAFTKAGLKVVYQFLTQPDYVNKPYRFIAEQATVTIATVGVVLKSLLREGYLIRESEKNYRLQNRQKLLEEWVNAYNLTLRPKLHSKRYRWLQKDKQWRKQQLPKLTYWGGTAAVAQLDDYLIPDQLDIYTGLHFDELMKTLKIIPDTEGTILITELFWQAKEEGSKLVHPILIYADLLHTATARHLEAAHMIYKKYIKDGL